MKLTYGRAILCCAMTMAVLTACKSKKKDKTATGVDSKIVGNWFSDVSGMTYAKWNTASKREQCQIVFEHSRA